MCVCATVCKRVCEVLLLLPWFPHSGRGISGNYIYTSHIIVALNIGVYFYLLRDKVIFKAVYHVRSQ